MQIESGKAKELNISRLEDSQHYDVKPYDPSQIHSPGDRGYASVKSRFGSLAATDKERVKKERKDSQFSVSPLLKHHLSIEEEEARAIQERVDSVVKEQLIALEEQTKKQGYQEGYQAGKADADALFNKQSQELLGKLTGLVQEMEGAKNEIFKAHEALLIEMVFRIARKVLLKEAAADKDLVLRTAKTVLEKLDARQNVTLKINPQDLKALTELDAQLKTALGEMRNLSIEPSERVSAGGVVVETDFSQVAVTIDSQIDALHAAATEGGVPNPG